MATIKYITYKDAEAYNFKYTTKTTETEEQTVRAVISLFSNVKRGLPRSLESIENNNGELTITISTKNTRVKIGTAKTTDPNNFDD